jgi:pilus assembly protein FimV
MFITCQNCDTTFRLDERLLKPGGSKVRCSQCSNVFVAYPQQPETPPPAVEESDTIGGVPVSTTVDFPSEAPLDEAPAGIDAGELDGLFEEEVPEVDASSEAAAFLPEAEKLDDIDTGDLDLDFDMELEPDEPEATVAEGKGTEEILDEADLEMDFDLDDIEAVEVQPANLDDQLIEDGAPEDLDIDLDEVSLDLDELPLDEEPAPVSAEQDATIAVMADDDLDFSLEEIEPADNEQPALAEAVHGDESEDLDLQLDLDFDEQPSGLDASEEPEDIELSLDDSSADLAVPAEKGSDDEELNLTDLDELIVEEEGAGEEIDLSLEEPELALDSDDVSPDEALEGSADEGLEDLDFELDAEFEDKPVAKAAEKEAPPKADEDLDLSDIEQLLEGEISDAGKPAAGKAEAAADGAIEGDEFDLAEFEAAIDASEDAGAESDDTILDEELEFDIPLDGSGGNKAPVDADSDATVALDDLELDLEINDQNPVDESEELDLQLDLESEAPEGELALEEEDELDLSDLSSLVEEPDSTGRKEVVDAGDMELEFEIEETPQPKPAVAARPRTPKTSDAVTELAVDETITAAAMAAPEKPPVKPKPKAAKPKKGTSKSLVAVLIIILLGAGGYLGYDYVVKNNIQIPYLSDYLNPKAKDPAGTLNLSTMEITSKFIENENSGRLFIITGKVRNGYTGTRGQIMLRGKLFSKGKVLVKTETTYAGVTITDQELGTLTIQEIKGQLNAVPKPEDIGTLVRPGQTLPFLVVFADLPEDLDEFVIETVGSKPIQ